MFAAATPTVSPTAGVSGGAGEAAIDPTLLALLSIFGGAMLTALAGVWGAWRQSRREHTRWVRERRYDAYTEFVQIVRSLLAERASATELRKTSTDLDKERARITAEPVAGLSAAELDDRKARLDNVAEREKFVMENILSTTENLKKLNARSAERVAAFYLLGPRRVTEAAVALGDVLNDRTRSGRKELQSLESAMRDALGVQDYTGT